MICDICGKKMTIFPGILSYNTTHICLFNSEVVHMYDTGDELVYRYVPQDLDNIEGLKIREFSRSFVRKESKAKNTYYIKALRNSTINRLLSDII